MFSQTVDYALRAMIYLASLRPGVITSAGRIAHEVDVPPRYLSKVMRGLVLAKLVESARGPHGGFALRASPDTVTLCDIVHAVGSARARVDSSGKGSHSPGRDAHGQWRGGMRRVEIAMRCTTLSDMLHEHEANRSEYGHGGD